MAGRLTLVVCGLLVMLVGCGNGNAVSAPEETALSPGQTAAVEPPVGEDRARAAADEERELQARLEALRDDVRAHPEDPQARRRLAIALHESRRSEEALPHFEAAAKLNPSERHLLDLALAYTSVSRLAEAEAVYTRLLEIEPGHAVAWHNLGNVAMVRGDAPRAAELYAKALAAQPGYLMARYHLAEALEQAGRHREAYRSFENVLELEPSDAGELELYDDALYRLAALDLKMGATQRAARMLAQLIEANPEHPSAHYAFGQALLQLGQPERAARELEVHMKLQARNKPSGPVASRD